MKFEPGDVCFREGVPNKVYLVMERRRMHNGVYARAYSTDGVRLWPPRYIVTEQVLYPAPSALIPDEVLRVSTILKLGGNLLDIDP